jgi:chromosomal replication initiation ATPase DnaA
MNEKVLDIIKALEDSILNIGVEKTIKNLKNPRNSEFSSLIEYIKEIVAELYNIKNKDLSKKNKSQLQIKASQVVSYLLYYHAYLTQHQIGQLLNRSKGSINRYITDINSLDVNISEEKDLKKMISKLEDKILNYKNDK